MERVVPTSCYTWDLVEHKHEPPPQTVLRVLQDIAELNASPLEGIFISLQENNVTTIHVLMVGSVGTPYEGGFFQFLLRCPPDYPLSPPRMSHITTDAGRVRFNVHLDRSGEVDVSTIGTATGPGWTSAYGLASVLLSVQSVMGNRPYFNGLDKEKQPGDSDRYNEFVRHETLRVAVCGQVESALKKDPQCPPSFRHRILDCFLKMYDKYENIAESRLHLTATEMKDVYSPYPVGTFQFKQLLVRLNALKMEVHKRNQATDTEAAKKAAEEAAEYEADLALAQVAEFENEDRLPPVYDQSEQR
ncbi:hypothetical protein V5799_024272 [Amblyomma americanum]|uniref:Ubiquitin-conjugating enzyme E2 Z n=1 Tax=Amblyomma americanum TaxID=6943 RepID=A0AAQ4ECS6_AMBAM